jgi:hypothetical protein
LLRTRIQRSSVRPVLLKTTDHRLVRIVQHEGLARLLLNGHRAVLGALVVCDKPQLASRLR